MTSIHDLSTPALLVDSRALEHNLSTLATALPGVRARPHVKAHKCTALAKRQHAHGHSTFCAATPLELCGMAEAGLGEDLLLANESVDPQRLSQLAKLDARITVAVDSQATIDTAAAAGLRETLIDVNVGLPRCGCPPDRAAEIAQRARDAGLTVRGVMGYEGHVVGQAERATREEQCEVSMKLLAEAHAAVGGEVMSAGGTGTYDINRWANELQVGSYALMDTAYGELGLPFEQALSLWCTVVSVSEKFAVLDGGLKSLGMDHGNPTVVGGKLWFCSDEHITFAPEAPVRVGERMRVIPAHVDPTIAYHAHMHVTEDEQVLERWAVDLRGW